ncbi:D-aspartate oxidase, partial [Mycena leptocephala]
VFVVGAGVIGLSTAIRAREAGFDVTIFAEIFPGDEKSIKYTSCWAGADHLSIATAISLQHELERETFSVFMGLLKEDRRVPVMVRPHATYWQTFGPDDQKIVDHFAQFYSDFRTMEPHELPEGAVHGSTFSTASLLPAYSLCVDVPRYLPYLMDRFLRSEGRAFRVSLPSLSALLSEKDPVINCTGIGALSIGDVLGPDNPRTWVHNDSGYHYQDGHVSYVIPRQSGDVIIGGSFQPDDWHPISRPETVKLIKERGIRAFPELLPEDKRAARNIEDLDVIEECVGLRPTRKGGVRLEAETLDVGDKTIPIVHNYGHGGYGYQSSWGSAAFAVNLLKSVVEE